MFKSKYRPLLGVDISSTAVRILELSLSSSHYSVRAYGHVALPDNAVLGHVIQNREAVASSIKKILTMAPFSSRQAACAIPDALAISKIIQINVGLNQHEIEALVIVEAKHSIPYPIDEINLDFNVLGPSSKNTAMLDVLMVATKAEHVQHRMDVLMLAGLEPMLVDVESYVVERAVPFMVAGLPMDSDKKNVAILDIGESLTHLFVFQGMKLIFSREILFDGHQLMPPLDETMLLPIRRVMHFFSTTEHVLVDYVLLAGRYAMLPDLAELLQSQLNTPTYLANPLVNMCRLNEPLIQDAPLLIKAVGLAVGQLGYLT